MKATGIVRRIDDLGRVVIPKEIRRTLRIREGDPLEIYTERDGEVIFKKYSPMGELTESAGQICEALNKSTDHVALVCDRDRTPPATITTTSTARITSAATMAAASTTAAATATAENKRKKTASAIGRRLLYKSGRFLPSCWKKGGRIWQKEEALSSG